VITVTPLRKCPTTVRNSSLVLSGRNRFWSTE
jgi:hypothetical protein